MKFLVVVALLVGSVEAAVIRVPADQPSVQAGLAAMRAGDTLELAAGVYEGPVNLGAVPCTAALRCTLHGAGMYSTVVRGMRAEADWQDMGGGVWRRLMAPSVDPITTAGDGFPMRDAYDPALVVQRDAFPAAGIPEHLPLGYAGDGVLTPGDGRWSYHPATHYVYANPYGSAAPGELLVPFLSRLFDLRTSRGYWTLEDVSFEGSRAFGTTHEPTGGTLPGMVLRNVGGGYVPRFWAKLQPPLGIVVENVRLRWIARGMSAIVPSAQRSGYGLRLFSANGGTFSGVDCRHLGAGASWCGPSCMAPWNTDVFTTVGGAGHCVDIKQTDGFVVDGGVIDDTPSQGGVKLDVSRNGRVSNVWFSRNVRALVLNDQTKAQTPWGTFNATYNIAVTDNVFDGNGVDFMVASQPLLPAGATVATLQGNLRVDGLPLRTEPSPLPANVVVLGGTTSSTLRPTTSSTSASTSSSTTSTTTTTTASSTSSTTVTSTSSTTTTTCLCPCPCVVASLAGREA